MKIRSNIFKDRRSRAICVAALLSIIFLSLEYLVARWSFGFDFQETPSLGYRVAILKKEPSSDISVGDYVYFYNPRPIFKLSGNMIFFKKVVAQQGASISISSGELFIDDIKAGHLNHCKNKLSGNEMCNDRKYIVGKGQYFLMGTDDASYDSRYWDAISKEKVLGHVYPIY